MKFKITGISLESLDSTLLQGLILDLETELEDGKKHRFTYQNTMTIAGQPEAGVELMAIYAELQKLFAGSGIACERTSIPSDDWREENSYLVLLGDRAADTLVLLESRYSMKPKVEVKPNTTFSKEKAEFLFDTLKKNNLISDDWTKETFVGKIVGINEKIEEIVAKMKAEEKAESKAENTSTSFRMR